MNTLAYFDIMNLADRVKVPVLMSIGLIDRVTPPSTVFAAYNHLETEKELKVYRYFGHEYIPSFHTEKAGLSESASERLTIAKSPSTWAFFQE